MQALLSLLLICLALVNAYNRVIRLNPQRFFSRLQAEEKKSWSGDRPPVTNPEFLNLRMDASWGRGKYRSEVWEDQVNPLNDWWTAYAPTEEEIEASGTDYDFADPKSWFEKKGLDYEKSDAEYRKAQEEANAKFKADEELLLEGDLNEIQNQYFKLLNKAYLISLRKEDDRKQALKGQPSLDDEDTGIQYKNDPAP